MPLVPGHAHVPRAGTWQGLAVAVKTILFQESSYSRRVALQEAALSKSISHPNIVATYAVDARPIGVIRPRRSSAAGQAPGGGGAMATSTSTSSGERSMADIQDWRLYIIQVRQLGVLKRGTCVVRCRGVAPRCMAQQSVDVEGPGMPVDSCMALVGFAQHVPWHARLYRGSCCKAGGAA